MCDGYSQGWDTGCLILSGNNQRLFAPFTLGRPLAPVRTQVAKAAPATADVLSANIENAAERAAIEAPKLADRATEQIEARLVDACYGV